MSKYDLLRQQLLLEGIVEQDNFFEPHPVSEANILSTHEPEYWDRLSQLKLTPREQRVSGFEHNAALIRRETTIMEGTRLAAHYALGHGVAMNIAGGTHHAYTNRGEGFCLLNDIAIAANDLLSQSLVKKVLVVDLDVHQGNGTAEIFHGDDRVFTFSMHGGNNYPLRKEQSDLDIPLPDGTSDKAYLSELQKHLDELLENVEPDFLFFQSGVDVLESDKLGRLSLSMDGCKQRDRLVLRAAKDNGIPICASMGGGYSPEIKTIVEAHANTYRLAQDLYF